MDFGKLRDALEGSGITVDFDEIFDVVENDEEYLITYQGIFTIKKKKEEK